MNLNTLKEFRHGMYHCFGNAKDAQFNLVDALCSEAGASSFPVGSFSPFFERTWASLYEALDTARVRSAELATEVAARQRRTVVALLVARGLHPIIVGDRWYACASFLARVADVEAASLVGVKSNRVFYQPIACATRRSMATAWTSRSCSGTSPVCALPPKQNGGRRLSLVPTTNWCWHVP